MINRKDLYSDPDPGSKLNSDPTDSDSLFFRDLRFFCSNTYLNGPTVTLRPIPTLVWQRGEGLDEVVERLSINHLVGARAVEGRPCAELEGGREKKIFPAVRSHLDIS